MCPDTAAHVSVIIPAHNEGDNLVDTVGCVLEERDHRVEVIVVDDGSTDGSVECVLEAHGGDRLRVVHGSDLGVARARNAGAAQASGDMLVFLDAHCYVPDGWLGPLMETLSDPSIGLAGPTFASIREPAVRACGVTWNDPALENVWLPCPAGPQPVPFHIGACQAFRADAFRAIGGYDDGMTRWGSEDIEICLRMWLSGYEVYGEPRSVVYHLFRKSHPYAVDMADVIYNKVRMAVIHFDEDHLSTTLSRLRHLGCVERSLARAFTGDTIGRRNELLRTRKYDVDWLFDRFGIEM